MPTVLKSEFRHIREQFGYTILHYLAERKSSYIARERCNYYFNDRQFDPLRKKQTIKKRLKYYVKKSS